MPRATSRKKKKHTGERERAGLGDYMIVSLPPPRDSMSAEGAGLRLSGRSNLRVSSGSAMSRSGGLRRVSGASSAGGSDATSEHSSMHRSSPKPKRHGEARGISSASLARASSAGRTKRKKGSGFALEYVIVFDFIVEFRCD